MIGQLEIQRFMNKVNVLITNNGGQSPYGGSLTTLKRLQLRGIKARNLSENSLKGVTPPHHDKNLADREEQALNLQPTVRVASTPQCLSKNTGTPGDRLVQVEIKTGNMSENVNERWNDSTQGIYADLEKIGPMLPYMRFTLKNQRGRGPPNDI